MLSVESSDENAIVQIIKKGLPDMITEEGVNRGLSFKPRSNDVFVVTPPKCGTTWMQQILHQLRSGGDMSFSDISEEIPFIEYAYDIEMDLEAEQKYQPR